MVTYENRRMIVPWVTRTKGLCGKRLICRRVPRAFQAFLHLFSFPSPSNLEPLVDTKAKTDVNRAYNLFVLLWLESSESLKRAIPPASGQLLDSRNGSAHRTRRPRRPLVSFGSGALSVPSLASTGSRVVAFALPSCVPTERNESREVRGFDFRHHVLPRRNQQQQQQRQQRSS
jgi:hypothetical protein